MAADDDGVTHRDVGTDRSDRTRRRRTGRCPRGSAPTRPRQPVPMCTTAGPAALELAPGADRRSAGRSGGSRSGATASRRAALPSPTRRSVQVSSAHGSLPVSTRLGRKRSMPNGSDACARRCSRDAVAVTRIGAASVNGAACPKTSRSSGSRHPPGWPCGPGATARRGVRRTTRPPRHRRRAPAPATRSGNGW